MRKLRFGDCYHKRSFSLFKKPKANQTAAFVRSALFFPPPVTGGNVTLFLFRFGRGKTDQQAILFERKSAFYIVIIENQLFHIFNNCWFKSSSGVKPTKTERLYPLLFKYLTTPFRSFLHLSHSCQNGKDSVWV